MLTARFEDALVYAAQLHREQVRKGTAVPYVAHLLAVTALVIENGGDEDTAIAALLHDAVEDQGGAMTRLVIQQRFGERVAAIVDGCTDAETFPKPPWLERKQAYIAHLEAAPPEVLLVSCADKLHNARSILSDYRVLGDELWGRFNGGKEGTLWYYAALAEAFGRLGPAAPAAELARVLDELTGLVAEYEVSAAG